MATVLLITTGTNSGATPKCASLEVAHLRSKQHSCPLLCFLPSSLSTTQKDTLFKKHQVSFANKIHKLGTNLDTRAVVGEVKDHIIKLL